MVSVITGVETCVHCVSSTRRGYRRGLCHLCYRSPMVRRLYPQHPSTYFYSDTLRQGVRPLRPTRALPGTDAKIAVMQARAERRERLFHPDDAKEDE